MQGNKSSQPVVEATWESRSIQSDLGFRLMILGQGGHCHKVAIVGGPVGQVKMPKGSKRVTDRKAKAVSATGFQSYG